MANRACLARLRKELKCFEAPPYIRATPLEHNLQEWRFVLQGPPNSPYEGGMYQGKVRFPDDYPFKPPSIFMLTPNGRFETDRRLCLSISDFHPETWNPTWSVASIVNGVLSFMLEETPTTGSVVTTIAEKHRLRDASVAWNAQDATFCQLWPELVDGQPFYAEPAHATANEPTVPPAQPAAPPAEPSAPIVLERPSTDGDEAHSEDQKPTVPGQGKNAKANKKKREKEKAKRREAEALAASAPEAVAEVEERPEQR